MATKPRRILPLTMTAYGAKGGEQFPVADESLYKRNVDESATKLEGPAKQPMNPKHVCNSEGLKVSFRAPAQTKPKGGTHAQTATTIVEATKGEDTRSEEQDRTGRDHKRSGGGPPLKLQSMKGGPALPATPAT